eukprot:6456598-Amphidinium_carterae.1
MLVDVGVVVVPTEILRLVVLVVLKDVREDVLVDDDVDALVDADVVVNALMLQVVWLICGGRSAVCNGRSSCGQCCCADGIVVRPHAMLSLLLTVAAD